MLVLLYYFSGSSFHFFPPWAVPMLSNVGFKLQSLLFCALGFPGACGGKRGWVGKLISEFSCVAQVF